MALLLSLLWLLSGFTTLIALAFGILYWLLFREPQSFKGKPMAVYCPSGYLESIQQLASSNCPWWLLDMAHQAASFVYRVRVPGIHNAFVVGEPKLARMLLKDPDCQGKPIVPYAFSEYLSKGPSVFSSHGSAWAHRRRGIAPSFSSAHIKRMNQICQNHVQQWIESKKEGKNGAPIFNVSEEMVHLSISVICESAFEYNITSEEINVFLHELELAVKEFFQKQDAAGIRTLIGPYFIEEHRRARLASDRLEQFALKVIQAHRDNPNASSETVLGRIINNPNYKDDLDRASEVVILLLGGHDTTGYTLAWIFLELARHPEEMNKLRTDLLQQGPDNWKQSLALKNVIREAMRLNPVAAGGSGRIAGRDIVYRNEEKNGKEYIIPKDSILIIPFLLLHRNANVYEKADQFIPSRWDTMKEKGLEAYMPFSLGSRNCAGQALANAELYSTVARVVMNFDLEVVEKGETDYFMTLKPDGALLRAIPIANK